MSTAKTVMSVVSIAMAPLGKYSAAIIHLVDKILTSVKETDHLDLQCYPKNRQLVLEESKVLQNLGSLTLVNISFNMSKFVFGGEACLLSTWQFGSSRI